MIRRLLLLGLALVAIIDRPLADVAPVRTDTLPASLSDQEFWQLSVACSEPNGFFRSENLVSNEHTYQNVVPALKRQLRPGGVYLGVAPDQNFTYIVATEPHIAFIVDIRRGNLLEHLMYKAVLELSADRAEFVSRLFSKPRPKGLGPASTVAQIFEAYDRTETSEALYHQNLADIRDVLVGRHHFALSDDDLEQLGSIYFAFFWEGPGLRYTTSSIGGRGYGFPGAGTFMRGLVLTNSNFPSYEDLQLETDAAGEARSYLATEANYQFLRTFEQKNLLVPVVGNFAGPKALRAVGQWVHAHGATIGAFYVSNVEQYLFQDGIFGDWARNVATLPVDPTSVFIRSVADHFGYLGGSLGPDGRASALDPIRAFVKDFTAGRINTYMDVNARSR